MINTKKDEVIEKIKQVQLIKEYAEKDLDDITRRIKSCDYLLNLFATELDKIAKEEDAQ